MFKVFFFLFFPGSPEYFVRGSLLELRRRPEPPFHRKLGEVHRAGYWRADARLAGAKLSFRGCFKGSSVSFKGVWGSCWVNIRQVFELRVQIGGIWDYLVATSFLGALTQLVVGVAFIGSLAIVSIGCFGARLTRHGEMTDMI